MREVNGGQKGVSQKSAAFASIVGNGIRTKEEFGSN
jgi:hypothetical protein